LGDELAPTVECHSGYDYAGRPLALHWQGGRLVISEVENAWRSPEGKCFRVRTEDGRRFELVYNEQNDEWRVIPA
jgi:hypothetical protein